MKSTASKAEIINTCISVLKDKADFAYFYGSVAKGHFRADSDIDIAVYLKKRNPAFKDRLELITELGSHIDRQVDLVLLNQCDPVIAMQVLGNGRLILNENNTLRVQYILKQLSLYADLRISRKIIEEHLLNGGLYA
jgi:predicted nucleotidyltransferase